MTSSSVPQTTLVVKGQVGRGGEVTGMMSALTTTTTKVNLGLVLLLLLFISHSKHNYDTDFSSRVKLWRLFFYKVYITILGDTFTHAMTLT